MNKKRYKPEKRNLFLVFGLNSPFNKLALLDSLRNHYCQHLLTETTDSVPKLNSSCLRSTNPVKVCNHVTAAFTARVRERLEAVQGQLSPQINYKHLVVYSIFLLTFLLSKSKGYFACTKQS